MGCVNFYRKPISMFVMVAFTILLFLWANQSPAASSPLASGKKSATSLEKRESESPGFFEQEESKPAVKKHKTSTGDLAVVCVIVAVVVVAVIMIAIAEAESSIKTGPWWDQKSPEK